MNRSGECEYGREWERAWENRRRAAESRSEKIVRTFFPGVLLRLIVHATISKQWSLARYRCFTSRSFFFFSSHILFTLSWKLATFHFFFLHPNWRGSERSANNRVASTSSFVVIMNFRVDIKLSVLRSLLSLLLLLSKRKISNIDTIESWAPPQSGSSRGNRGIADCYGVYIIRQYRLWHETRAQIKALCCVVCYAYRNMCDRRWRLTLKIEFGILVHFTSNIWNRSKCQKYLWIECENRQEWLLCEVMKI